MSEFNPAIAAFTSLLCFLTVFLGVKWIGPAWDSFVRRHISDFEPRVKSLGMDDAAVQNWMRIWGLTILAILIGLIVIKPMVPVAIGLAYLVFISPRYVLDHLIEKRKIVLRDQLVQVAVGLANSSRAGLGLEQGFRKMSEQVPAPMQRNLDRVVRSYDDGIPFEDALRNVERTLDLESFSIFTSAVLVCRESGGRETVALDSISAGLQELQRLDRKLESDSASGRRLALLLGMFPFFFMAGFTLLDPVSMSYLYNTLAGQIVLLVIGGIVVLAVRWCMHILDLDF